MFAAPSWKAYQMMKDTSHARCCYRSIDKPRILIFLPLVGHCMHRLKLVNLAYAQDNTSLGTLLLHLVGETGEKWLRSFPLTRPIEGAKMSQKIGNIASQTLLCLLKVRIAGLRLRKNTTSFKDLFKTIQIISLYPVPGAKWDSKWKVPTFAFELHHFCWYILIHSWYIGTSRSWLHYFHWKGKLIMWGKYPIKCDPLVIPYGL